MPLNCILEEGVENIMSVGWALGAWFIFRGLPFCAIPAWLMFVCNSYQRQFRAKSRKWSGNIAKHEERMAKSKRRGPAEEATLLKAAATFTDLRCDAWADHMRDVITATGGWIGFGLIWYLVLGAGTPSSITMVESVWYWAWLFAKVGVWWMARRALNDVVNAQI